MKTPSPLLPLFLIVSLILSPLCSTHLCANNDSLNAFLDPLVRFHRIKGAVAISKNNKILYQRSFNSDSTALYRVGSVTKIFTAILIWQQVQQGKILPQQKLSHWFPSIAQADSITLDMLLSHSSGLKDYSQKGDTNLNWLFQPVSNELILQEIEKQGTAFAPGTSYKYSNTGYYLLARIIEKIYHKSYDSVLTQQILQPLGLQHTFASVEQSPYEALPVVKNTSHQWESMVDFYFPNVSGVGDLLSTPTDLCMLLNDLFINHLCLDSTYSHAMRPQGKIIFGHGLMKAPFYNQALYGHGGTTFGSYTLAFFNPKDSICVALCLNGAGIPTNDVLLGIFNVLYQKPLSVKEDTSSYSYQVNPKQLHKYQGVYACNEPVSLRLILTVENNNLKGQVAGQPSFYLEPFRKDVFKFRHAGLTLKFLSGKKQCHLSQRGLFLSLKKIKQN